MAGETVTIASGLPHGLILQLQAPQKIGQRPDIDATGKPVYRDMTVSAFVGQRYVLKGVAPINARLDVGRVVEGKVLTHGIPLDFWKAWVEQNKDLDCLTKGIVVAHVKDTAGAAREVKGEKSGFEPMDPANMPAEFRRTIETARA